MSSRSKAFVFIALVAAAACGADSSVECCRTGEPSLRVVNAFTTPVDVVIDGAVAIQGLAAGSIAMASPSSGDHQLVLRPTSGAAASQSITTSSSAISTIAVVRSVSGSAAGVVLDDTNSVVAPGKTKLRVLHLAPNAGTLQVYRTQPDYQTPIAWQFPFNYQPDPTSLSAPFYESTPGTWEVRIWQTPADASGWANAPVKVVVPLTSGEKHTIMILDRPGGGVRYEIL